MKILIVDNEPDMVLFVKDAIKGISGAEIVTFTEWTDAIDAIEMAPCGYDLVITDFRMPRGSEGRVVARTAREKDPRTRIIVMSSDMTENDRRESDAHAYLSKPFGMEELIGTATKLLPNLNSKLPARSASAPTCI